MQELKAAALIPKDDISLIWPDQCAHFSKVGHASRGNTKDSCTGAWERFLEAVYYAVQEAQRKQKHGVGEFPRTS